MPFLSVSVHKKMHSVFCCFKYVLLSLVGKKEKRKKKIEFKVIGHPLKIKTLDLPEVLKLHTSDIKGVNETKSLEPKTK